MASVPKGNCFIDDGDVGGDESGVKNRRGGGHSVPLALLKGRAMCVMWPPSRWGVVESRVSKGRVLAMGNPTHHQHEYWLDRFVFDKD